MCNKCKGYYLSGIQRCNINVRHCKKCKNPVIISISIKKTPANLNFTRVLCKNIMGDNILLSKKEY